MLSIHFLNRKRQSSIRTPDRSSSLINEDRRPK
jgi:hypothetical protein